MNYATVDQLARYLDQVDLSSGAALMEECLTRATGIIRAALRAALADPSFDYAEWPATSTKIVRVPRGEYARIPPHRADSVTLIEYMSGSNPATYTALPDEWLEEGNALYRAAGWTPRERLRVTAVWGYGPDVDPAIQELTLELAVNIHRAKDTGGFVESTGVEGQGSVRVVAGLNKLQQQTIANIAAQYQPLGV